MVVGRRDCATRVYMDLSACNSENFEAALGHKYTKTKEGRAEIHGDILLHRSFCCSSIRGVGVVGDVVGDYSGDDDVLIIGCTTRIRRPGKRFRSSGEGNLSHKSRCYYYLQ